ncbi:MAG: AMP-binding protein [Burkholderiaceae bacterium]|jgi:long-chain acyl-CoA synthetase|nr:AMP-binding protein [Burkholderiaceae bacterium]MDH5208086.1 AMP-binding protein [Burkholderiaceae bacterium]
MDKVWLKQYPEGIPAEVDFTAYSSLKEILASSCARFADLPAYGNMGVSITYRELDQLSRDFGAYLQKVAGLKKGDRLAIMLPNLLQYPVALFGAQRAGVVVVNTNPLYTARELEHQLKDSGATAIVVLENFAHTLQEVLPRTPVKTVITTQIGDMFPAFKRMLTNLVVKHVKKMVPEWHMAQTVSFNDALAAGRVHALDDVTIHLDDLAFLQYTGGTTGVAKGAMLTQANMVANLQQVAPWIARDLLDGEETALIPLPLYHVFALTVNLVFMKIGAHIVLVTNPRDFPAFIHLLKKTPITAMIGVNTLYNALLNAPGFSELNLHALKICAAGGMAVQRAVAERWKAATGVPLIEGYGLTETSPIAISNPLNIEEWSGNIGLPIPSTEAAILDDSGAVLPIGQVGEIAIRGPQVMKGYWNRPEETAKVFTADGWFRTGDMGIMDAQGHFKITDRKKDMIIVSGFKVFPNEVEDVVMLHPGVMEVAAIGVPDEKSGEAVKIVVVKKDAALTERELLEHCRQHLTNYKVPRIVEFRTEPLPKTNIGKILRRELRTPQPKEAVAA